MVATRLQQGQDLKNAICTFVTDNNYSSASVVSAVGSLSQATLRMAGAQPDNQDVRVYDGVYEIVSLIGTIDSKGNAHLHMSIADSEGQVSGGHLKEGSIIYTTAEITLVTDPSLHFERKIDPTTGFDELYIEETN